MCVFPPNFFSSCLGLLPWLLIAIGCGFLRFGTTLMYVPVTPAVAVAYRNHVVGDAISITVAVIVVPYGGSCYCGKHCGSEIGRC